MLTPGNTANSFYIDGDLVDTVMLDYYLQQTHNGALFHKKRQAVSKLRIVADELFKGHEVSSVVSDDQIKNWVKQASV